MEIKNTIQITDGVWLVEYLVPHSCGCCGKTERKTIEIKQKEKPTHDEIKNTIEGLRI